MTGRSEVPVQQLCGQDASFLYCGRIAVAVTACRAMLPDPRFYEDCLRASFEDLCAATLGPSQEAR